MRIKDLERAMGEVTKDSDLSRSCLRLADVLCVAETCINRLETEFSSYKVGLMLFFRVKMLNWLATRDNEQVKSLEESLKEAEKEVLSVSAERDKALQDLKDSLAYHERELSERDTALSSTDVGKKLTVGSTTIVKKVSLELGGNAPCIIFDDADLDVAVRGIVS
nr:protein GRIP isoform X2 [Ipomoea batatas]